MNPLGDLAELFERRRDLAPGRVEALARAGVVQLLLEDAQLERERDEPLLRAVVQVALQPLPLLLACFEDARPRSANFLQARSQLGLKPEFSAQ